MSFWTEISVIAEDDDGYVPSRREVEEIVAFLGIDRWSAVHLNSRRHYWDEDDGSPAMEFPGGVVIRVCDTTSDAENVSIAEGLDLWEERQAVFTSLIAHRSEFGHRLCTSLQSIPEEIGGGCAPDGASLEIGPATIPDWQQENTQAYTSFQIGFGGQGMPEYGDQYRRLVLATPEIQSLLKFLTELTERRWAVLLSWS
jgi:hypothetical protein